MSNKAVISKQYILDTAYSLFKRPNAGSLSIRGVAAACNVSVGSIYNYFPTKADLVAEVIGTFWRESLRHDMLICETGENFVIFCERLYGELGTTLEAFRRDWLTQLSTLDSESLREVRKREEATFVHVRHGLALAIKNDPDIDLAPLGDNATPERLAALVWSTMISSLKNGDTSCEMLFALMREALYK